MVFQTAEGDIAVVGVFVDLDAGTAAASNAATVQVVTPPSAKRNVGHHPHSRRGEAASAPRADSHLDRIIGLLTSSLTATAGTSSALLETVFTQVEEIASPGSVVKTQPLVMSDLVNTLLAGSFQR